jgi:hypothetical protein
MRFREFKSFLLEYANQEVAVDPLQKLADIASETDPDDPFHEKAIEIRQMALAKAATVPEQEPEQQPEAEPQQQPVQQQQPALRKPQQPIQQPNTIGKPATQPSTVQTQAPITPIAEKLDAGAAVKPTRKPAGNKVVPANVAGPADEDEAIWEEYLNSLQDPAQRKAMAKDAQLKATMLSFIKHYESTKQASKKVLSDLAGEVLDRISKGGASESEKDALLGIFKQHNIPEEQMKFFLEGAKSGKIINMTSLVKSYTGKIDEHVRGPYKAVFVKVISNFFNLADGMRTAGNIGPGEVAFVLLGDPAEKMEKGDLRVGKETFEVKASSDTPGKMTKKGVPGASKPNGAVFGAKVNQKPASAWPIVQDILNKYGIEQTTRPGGIDPETGKTKELQRFKINASGMTDLNQQLDALKMPKAKRAKLMADILEQLFPKIVKQDKTAYVSLVTATMDPKTGHFPTQDSGELMKLLAKTSLVGYKLEKHKENFIFFNKTSRTYYVFRGDEMNDAIEDGTIRLFKGIDWSDGQYPAAPKMYIA